jgi:hypothetical protein
MITLDQIRLLEKKVHAAVAQISNLKHENSVLKEKLQSYEKRINELEARIGEFKQDQSEIEQGILSALDQLDKLEDDVLEGDETEARAGGDVEPGADAQPGAAEHAPASAPTDGPEVNETPADTPAEAEPAGADTSGADQSGEGQSGDEEDTEGPGEPERPSEDSEERGELDIF